MANEMINSEWVIMKNKKAVTTSLKIADVFGKRHKNVLQSIENLMAENSAVKKYFAKTTYKNERNREYPMYYLNRDGFTLLAMGFTGKEATQFKIKLIEEFNRMEDYIKETNETGIAMSIPDDMKHDPMILQNNAIAQALVQLNTQRIEQVRQEQRLNALSDKVNSLQELQDFKTDVSTQSALTLEIKSLSRSTGLSQREIRNMIYDRIATISGVNIHGEVDRRRKAIQKERIEKAGEPYKESTLRSKAPIYKVVQDLGLNSVMAEVVHDLKTKYKQHKL